MNRDDRFAGLSATIARKVMRFFDRALPESLIDDYVGDDKRKSSEIARALAAEGLLELDHVEPDGERWWKPTVRGSALAQASFRAPVARATAERLLGEVIERAHRFNAVPGHVIEIAELIVFGSYLDPTKDRLGDLDLAVKFRDLPTDATPEERMKKRLAYSRASGRRFAHFNAKLSWPEEKALLALRKRSPTINITTQDVGALTERWQVVFRADWSDTGGKV